MYFYVFLQPEVFEEAQIDGEDAVLNIMSIIKGFLQNCFVAVFEDDRWGQNVKEKIKLMPANDLRKRITEILKLLNKRNRFMFCIIPDYEGITSDLDCVLNQSASIPLDLLLVTEKGINHEKPKGVEISTRRKYLLSDFETVRSELLENGKTCLIGEMDETAYMQFHFAKSLKHAMRIEICDRVCGKKNFADNFRYTTKRLLHWIEGTLNNPSQCRIIFHMGQPKGQGDQHIINEISSCKVGRLNETSIEINFYGESLPDPGLPHQRFILTDQIALDIDRGLDFLDSKTRRCRDTHVTYQNMEDAKQIIKNCAPGRLSSFSI